LSRLARDAPFWIRLRYTVPDDVSDSSPEDALTIRRLIDVLSRRPRESHLGKSIDAGPFRLSD
jgi:hypothetical protein